MSNNSKKLYIEWLRVIAILFVIYNHTATRGFDLYLVSEEVSSRWLSIVMVPVCKIAVPIFFMISGVNLLSKQETLKELYSKRVLRHLIVIVLFGTLQYLRYVRSGNAVLSFGNWIDAIYTEPMITPYWFLYLYFGFLLALPFLRKMAVHMEKKDFVYLFMLMVTCQVLRVASYFSGKPINGYVFAIIGTSSFFYPLIGYAIDKYSTQADRKKYGVLAVGSLALIIIMGNIYRFVFPGHLDIFGELLQSFTPMLAAGIFGFVKTTCKQKENAFSKVLVAIGGTTFGVYLTEEIIRRQVDKIMVKMEPANYMNDFVVVVGYVLVVFVIGVCGVYVVKKVPGVKKLL